MNDEQLNVLLKQLRNGLMPTRPVEEIFNLTLHVERPIREATLDGETHTVGWKLVDEFDGALDEYCKPEKVAAHGSQDAMMHALYCIGDAKIQPDDRVTGEDAKGAEVVLRVNAVSNPMMQYRYLVAWCTLEDSRRDMCLQSP
ncbi:MAG: hypothetical protein ACXV76_04420 [Halobacteriota archaeon]